MTERQALVLVYSFISFGPARVNLLLSYFGSSKTIWNAQKEKLLEVGLNEKIVNDFLEYRGVLDTKKYFQELKKRSIEFITFKDKDYPENLKGLENAPLVLYIKGKIYKSDANSIAVVGSRKMTAYGRKITEYFTQRLSNLGLTIISGLALGVDTKAHQTALEQKGRTLAILACGLDRVYPAQNKQLAKKIERQGALISEYPLGYPPLKGNFVARNRIISGLSRAVLVVEGEKKSGTLLTASAAADQGRPLFAIPGEITSSLSGAPHFLIQRGAKLTTSVEDILEELQEEIAIKRD